MNKDIQKIFENYTNTWDMTPKQSFKRDKRFFTYVIENNKELHPLKSLPTKVIFELYKLKLRSFYDTQHPGVITENTNLTHEEVKFNPGAYKNKIKIYNKNLFNHNSEWIFHPCFYQNITDDEKEKYLNIKIKNPKQHLF